MLKKRLLTAAIALPLLLLSIIFLPPILFVLLIGFVMLLAAWEWALLSGIEKKSYRIFYVIFIFFGLFLSAVLSSSSFLWIAALIWVWLFFAILAYEKNESPLGFEYAWVRKLTGFFIIVASWGALVIIRENPNFGARWLIVLLLLIFAADTGAYFAGRFFGRRPLSPRVSPKKTWEGFIGGMVFSVFIAAVSGGFLVTSLKQYSLFLGLSLVTAIFSAIGDLGVSLQKRIVNVKDSGMLFPGHGGLLDRLDSVAAASVVFVLGALWLGL